METNERGFIKVDKYQNTNVEGIYAVGDIIEGGIELTPLRLRQVVAYLSVYLIINRMSI